MSNAFGPFLVRYGIQLRWESTALFSAIPCVPPEHHFLLLKLEGPVKSADSTWNFVTPSRVHLISHYFRRQPTLPFDWVDIAESLCACVIGEDHACVSSGCSSHSKYCETNSSFFNACPQVLFFEWTTTLLMPSSHSKTQPKLLIALAITYLWANLLSLHHLFQRKAGIKGLSDTRWLGNVGIDNVLELCWCEEMRRSDLSVGVSEEVGAKSVKGRGTEIFISRWHHCWRTPVVLLLKMVHKLQSHCFLLIEV